MLVHGSSLNSKCPFLALHVRDLHLFFSLRFRVLLGSLQVSGLHSINVTELEINFFFDWEIWTNVVILPTVEEII
jgi:hypothetical protein